MGEGPVSSSEGGRNKEVKYPKIAAYSLGRGAGDDDWGLKDNVECEISFLGNRAFIWSYCTGLVMYLIVKAKSRIRSTVVEITNLQ
jgi:hypothetical protein